MNLGPLSRTLLALDRAAETPAPLKITIPAVTIPAVTDLVGYDALIAFIRKEGLDRMRGDFLEIGCFLGGGTAKLARLARVTGRAVWVIDVFDPDFDHTANTGGTEMAALYQGYLQNSNQETIFHTVTAPWSDCIHVIKEDSRKAKLPEDTRVVFGFGDGNHDPIWVRNDFQLIWHHLVPGGWAGFHDYGGDLPEVTAALDEMMRDHAGEIERVERIPERWVLLVKKRALANDFTGKDSPQ